MEITCPKCGFTKNIPDEKIPKRAQIATCPKCSHKFKFRELSPDNLELDEAHYDTDQHSQENRDIWSSLEELQETSKEKSSTPFEGSSEDKSIPWEHLEEKGFFAGFFKTIKLVCLSPKDFFKKMSVKGVYLRPLIFYLLISEFYTAFRMFWQIMGFGLSVKNYQDPYALLGLHGFASLLILILYPIFLTIGLAIGTLINHGCLLLVKDGEKGIKGTFKVLCYSSAPIILSIIPYVGGLIGIIWSAVCTFIGFKYVHKTSTTKIIIAMAIPIVVVFLLSLIITSNFVSTK